MCVYVHVCIGLSTCMFQMFLFSYAVEIVLENFNNWKDNIGLSRVLIQPKYLQYIKEQVENDTDCCFNY
ncbi:unnamed protein product [Brugia timori]|uniref:Uncharacterized protein n=1 Tax=Brugia timori TaxID=42155 RepID=A0A0R3R5G0_9BILA|nr:unnamed protein product [Brugia timori]